MLLRSFVPSTPKSALSMLFGFLFFVHWSKAETLVWSDEFNVDGAPNPQFWTADLGNWGWGNNELENYQQENAVVRNGNLYITANRSSDGTTFTSARIKTLTKVTFKYGRLEASLKIPDLANGLWPAFWTLGHDFPVVGWPICGEFDIMEMGKATYIKAGLVHRQVGSAVHWDNFGTNSLHSVDYTASSNLDDGNFHNFTLNWTPDWVSTYVDGHQIMSVDITQPNCPGCEEFHKPHFILLNMAVGGYYTGSYTPQAITAPMPAEYVIDYVRIYSNQWTELGGTHFTPTPSLTNCGCSVCTSAMLDQIATDGTGSYSCRDRINWVLSNSGYTEQGACDVISRQFPKVCGQACNPYTCDSQVPRVTNCGCGNACAASLDQDASGSTCRARMLWLMETLYYNEHDACARVSAEFPAICGVTCNPSTCSNGTITQGTNVFRNKTSSPSRAPSRLPSQAPSRRLSRRPSPVLLSPTNNSTKTILTTSSGSSLDCGCGYFCSSDTLDRIAYDGSGSFSCRARIEWVMNNEKMNETQACSKVAGEFPSLCAQGCDPSDCARAPPPAVTDCGCPNTCNSSVLLLNGTDSSGSYNCRDRINWVMGNKGLSEHNACVQVSSEFPSICGRGCDPNVC